MLNQACFWNPDVVTVELYLVSPSGEKIRVIDDREFDFLNLNLMIIVWDILAQQVTTQVPNGEQEGGWV